MKTDNRKEESKELIPSYSNSTGNSLFRAVFDNNQTIMLLVDPGSKQKIIDVNTAAQKFYGYSHDQFLELNMSDINTKTNEERKKLMSDAMQKPQSHFNFIHVTSTGLFKKVDVDASPLIYKDKKVMFIIVHDISALKETELALKESEERFKGLSDATTEAVFLSENGICIDQNKRAEELFGYTCSEAVGKHSVDWIAPDYKDIVARNIASEYIEKYEVISMRKDGSFFPSEIKGKMLNFKGRRVRVTVLRDLTDTKGALAELKKSNELFELAMAGSNLGLWDWWVQIGDLHINERWAEMLGYSLEEILPVSNDTWRNLCHPDDLTVVDTHFQRYLKKETDIYRADFRMKHKNGSWIWLQTQGKVFEWTEDGKPLRVAGTHLDINENKKTELELAESEAKFRSFFDNSPLSLWVEDTSEVSLYFKTLPISDIKSFDIFFDKNPDELEKCVAKVKVVDVNPATLKLYEAESKAEFIINFNRVFTKNSFAAYKTLLRSGYEKNLISSIETVNKTLKGKLINIKLEHVNLSEYRFFTTVIDITEQKSIANKLATSEERLGLALAGSDLGLWDEWIPTGELYVNNRWAEIIGYTLEEISPVSMKFWRENTHPDDLKEVDRIGLKSPRKEVDIINHDIRMKHKNGSWVWVRTRGKVVEWSDNGEPLRSAGTHLDITERKKTEVKLHKSEERFRSYFEISPLAMWEEEYTELKNYLHNLPVSGDGELLNYLNLNPKEIPRCLKLVKILKMNQSAVDIYEADSKEMLIENFTNIFTPESLDIFKDEIISLYNNDKSFKCIFADKTLKGREVVVNFEMTKLSENTYLTTSTDITELKKNENRLKELLSQTKTDSETKEILLREINHRVKNNLSSFIGMLYAEKKQSGSDPNSFQMEHVDNLINRVKGISIAHEMLSRSQWAPISINKLIEKIIHSLNHLIPKDRVINVKLNPSNIFLDADQSHSTSILLNELYLNSIEHASHTGEKLEVEIELREKKGTIIFIYRDSGSGYPEEVLKSEFKNVGMYLIKNIVEQSLRGVFRISNDGGVKIEIEFPGGSKLEEL